jgi:type IV secretory pathway VirB2 component (pilin)
MFTQEVPMLRSARARRSLLFVVCLGVALVLLAPSPAHAAGLESVANSLVSLFTGSLLIAAATLGGVFVAFRFWTGHHEAMTTFIWWAAGCGIAFGVRTMVSLFQS